MQRHPTTAGIVWFTADDIRKLIRDQLVSEGVTQEPIAVQSTFSEGQVVHNEMPGITVILAGAGM